MCKLRGASADWPASCTTTEHRKEDPIIAAAHESRTLEIDGETVVFEINVIRIPVPRPYLRYRTFQAGRPDWGGVLAEVREYPTSVHEQFTDAELARLYRSATELGHTSSTRGD